MLLPAPSFTAVHIVIDHCRIEAVNRQWSVIQSRYEIRSDIAHIACVLVERRNHILNVAAVQFEELRFYNALREVLAVHTDILYGGAYNVEHYPDDFVDPAFLRRTAFEKIIITDVLPDNICVVRPFIGGNRIWY